MGLSPRLRLFRPLPPSWLRRSPERTDAPKDVKGLFLMSDYPAVTLRPGVRPSTVNLRIQNYDMAPDRLALSVSGRAGGLDCDAVGRRSAGCGRAMPATNSSVALSLRARCA